MSSMKRVRLAVLFLVAVAVFAGTPALAAGTTSVNLECLVGATDPDYGAWGELKVANVRYEFGAGGYLVKCSVTCRDLTPGTVYDTRLGSFTASKRGSGSVQGEIFLYASPGSSVFVGVSVQREDGVYVLAGGVALSP